jgi:nucleoside-diphosphate-sugar epimerase
MKKVLLTGATGFLGRHVLPLLVANGYEVHAVSSQCLGNLQNRPQVHWHSCNLLDHYQIKPLLLKVQPTHLLHFAWCPAVPGTYWNDINNFSWVQASLSLMQEFANRGGARAVLAGTCAEYDWKYGYCSEAHTPLQPNTVYGKCKHSLELLSTSFSERVGIGCAWGRLFFLYGPHEHPNRLVSSIICSLLRGQDAPCSYGEQIRDFLHIEDAASAFVALLGSDVTGPINIASGYAVTIKEIANSIGDILNSGDRIQLGAVAAAQNDPRLILADVNRLENYLGWQPGYDLKGGLEQTINWWKKHYKGC